MKPAALFFDLDNTLIDDDASVQLSIERAYNQLKLHHLGDAAGFATNLRRLSDAYWESSAAKPLTIQESRLRFWSETLISYGCLDTSVHTAAVEAYAAYRREPPQLYEDAIEALQRLHGRVPLAVVTNGEAATQSEKMLSAGLWQYFDLVVAIDDAGASKPESAIFQHALDKMSLADPASVWHIGDSLANDVTGAYNAGLRSVWLNRRGVVREAHHPEPHHEIASLRELLALLESL